MARSYSCDHCGAREEAITTKNRRPLGWLSVRVVWPGSGSTGTTYDLCEKCAIDLKTFLGREV